mmetsp:Transcript_30128/g.65767  ORF Transcript_30128/g.65767 Transcript_30128/m.65767 type:complete len:499 (-) Transcript_30128:86-1582(-)
MFKAIYDQLSKLDLDTVFAYQTQKVVRIRDHRLGLLHILLLALIASYVVGYEVLYSNAHFSKLDVHGTVRLTLQQPTRGCNPNDVGCKDNYRSLRDLPYCSHYKGNSSLEGHQKDCIFADQHTLEPQGMLGDSIFIPTRIDTQVERKGCEPSEANNYTCDVAYIADAKPRQSFVADIDSYTVLLMHSYRRQNLQGNSRTIQGYYYTCEDHESAFVMRVMETVSGPEACSGQLLREHIDCIDDSCPFLSTKEDAKVSMLEEVEEHFPDSVTRLIPSRLRRRKVGSTAPVSLAAEAETIAKQGKQGKRGKQGKQGNGWETPGVFATSEGDAFKVSELLQLAGLSLDGTTTHEGRETLREAGTAIEINIKYENLRPFASTFGFSPITYTYIVNQRAMEDMKTEVMAQKQPNFPEERIMENRHGILITAKISGAFGFFSLIHLMVTLTTAVGLLGVSVVITDMLAIYVFPSKDIYRSSKIEETEGLSEITGGLFTKTRSQLA